jgi:hypothetical protein
MLNAIGIGAFVGASGAGRRQARANELRFCLRTDPKTFNPLLVEDESSKPFAT